MSDGIRKRDGRNTLTIQVAVPEDLVGRVRGASGRPVKVIERSLHTTDRREAKLKAAAERAIIMQMFASIRAGLPVVDEELRRIENLEMRRAFEILSADFLNAHPKLEKYAAELSESATDPFEAAIDPNPIFGGVPTSKFAEARLRELGRNSSPEAVMALSVSILKAHAAAVAALQKGITPPALPNRPIVSKTGTAPRVSVVAERYINARKDLKPNTIDQARLSFRLLVDFAGDPHFDALDRTTIARWADRLEASGLKAATINRHVTTTSMAWQWLRDRGEIADDAANPFSRHARRVDPDETGWLPFTVPELQKLLEPSPLRWSILVALFSGMRDSEIVAAKIAREGRQWYFEVARGKTPSARRIIPIHPTLLRLGLLDNRKELGRFTSRIITQRFVRWRRDQGITRERVTFHSLRGNFVSECERAGVTSDTIGLLVGHKGKRSFTLSTYARLGPGLKVLAEAIGKVQYRGLRLSN